ncbi:MAG: NAD-dependent epimerase/dehydratase family protein [Actinobacteria bacterium]|nr:NAD-dependent epimerase/dehydratase family protein [Actinomycetota bacterium]
MQTPFSHQASNGSRPRVLVTGGSGFIGSHVVDVLARGGYEPRIFDLRESPHHERGSVATVVGDATDPKALERAMEGCSAVIHLSAMADVGHVQADPVGAERANARATAAVLEAARNTEVERVVYGSTIWVYSDCPEQVVDESTRLAHPGHLYTATKLAGELYCRSYAELYGVDYTILRFGIPYGPRARVAAVVPAMVERALNGEPLTVAGDGSQGRRFVYVEDLAEGIVAGLRPGAANRVFNLAGTETTTILEIAQTVRDLLGDVEIVHTEARAGDFGGKEVSSERAQTELGWSASTPFREGVRRYVEWRRANEPVEGVPVRQPVPAPVSAPWRGRLTPRFPALPAPIARRALATAAAAGLLAWGVASDDSFSAFAALFGIRPATSVRTSRPQVGVIVDAPSSLVVPVSAQLKRAGASGSIATNGEVDPATVGDVRANGSDLIPRLKGGGPVRWVGTRQQIKHMARELGESGHIYYAPPRHGFTITQDLLGKTAGASAIRGKLRLSGSGSLGSVHRGDVVEVGAGRGSNWRATLEALTSELRSRGLRAIPADQLFRQG